MNFTVPRKHLKIRKTNTSNVNINISSNSYVSDNISELSEPVILDDDDKNFIEISDEDKIRKSKVVFKTKSVVENTSALNTASATSNKFLSYDKSFSRYYEVSASVIKNDNNLYIVTSAHHNVKKAITHPISQYTYSNFEPIFDLDFGTTNMLLSKKHNEKDLDFINNVYPQGVGDGSDVWGFTNKTIFNNTLFSEYYALATTEKGMVIYKLDSDERVVSGNYFCYPIQFISGNTENSWGDVKTYDVTTLTFNIKNLDSTKYIKKGTMIKFYIAKKTINGEEVELTKPIEVYGKILEVIDKKDRLETKSTDNMHSHMKTHHKEINKDMLDKSVNITVRMKTDYLWEDKDHAHHIQVVYKDVLKNKYKPYNLPKKVTAHLTVLNPERKIACYFTKENAGRLLAIDLSPVLNYQLAYVSYDYFDDSNKPFVITENDSSIKELGSVRGSHDVYVNEEQGVLYNVGINIKLDSGKTLKTAICYDLLENHLKPKAVSVIKDYPINYLHDFVVESYDRSEQIAILGIPIEKTTEFMFIGIGSTGDNYTIYDVTNINNIVKISSVTYEKDGYYHQAWFTSDKRYLATSDETQPDTVTTVNRVPLLRIYFDKYNEKLQLYHVQDFQNPFGSRNHNQYIVNNINLFQKNNNDFEDWCFGANYNSGVQVQSFKYKKYNRNDFIDEYSYEIRKDPFDIELIGYIDNIVGNSAHMFDGVWSVYPFWELETTADKIKYVVNGDNQVTFFRYKNGVYNNIETDLHNDGKVQKCHPVTILPKGRGYSEKYDEARNSKGTNRSSRINGITELVQLAKKDGTYENVILTPVGYSDKLDIQIYYVSITNSNIEEFIYLDCANDVKNNETIFGLCGNHICKGQVIKDCATDHYRVDKGQSLDPYNYASYIGLHTNNIFLYSSRVGEIITNLPGRSGDSGNPVVNKDNKFIGFINSIDVTGGNCGLVNVCKDLKQMLIPKKLPSKITDYTGFIGIYNNRNANILEDDPKKLSVIAINPRNGTIYYYLSSSITKYFLMNLEYSNFTKDERNNYNAITSKNYASTMFKMNNENYFSRSFKGGGFLRDAFVMYIESKEKCEFLFAEELIGENKNNGPRVVYLALKDGNLYESNYSEYNEIDKMYKYYILVYMVGLSSTNPEELFDDNLNINFLGIATGHPPKSGDIMKGNESKNSFKVINDFVTTENSRPSWYFNQSFRTIASVYPFSKNVPILFPYYARSANILENIKEYTFDEDNKLELTGFGENTIDQLNTSGLGIQAYQTNTINHESRITFSDGWNALDNNLNIPFEEKLSVLKLNGEPVNSDNLEYKLHSIPFEKDKIVTIETNFGEYKIPVMRFKDNVYGLI